MRKFVTMMFAVVSTISLFADIDDGAYLHLDATQGKFDFAISGGTNFVTHWYDVRSTRNIFATYYSYDNIVRSRPRLVENVLNGLPVVDTGYCGGGETTPIDNGGFTYPLFNVQSGFMVVRSKENDRCAFFIGHTGAADSNDYQFHRGVGSMGGPILINGYASSTVVNGKWRLNGEACDAGNDPLETTKFYLISFTLDAGVPVDTLAIDRTYRIGGIEYGEVILFDYKVTDEKRDEIESSLMAKWFGETPSAYTIEAKSVSFEGSDNELDFDSNVVIDALVGNEGVVVKAGEGEVLAKTYSKIDDVTINSGKLSLACSLENIIASADFHIDATIADSLVTNVNGLVTRINDVSTNGMYATINTDLSGAAGATLRDYGDGLKLIDLGQFDTIGALVEGSDACGFTWCQEFTDIHSIFVVAMRTNMTSSAQFLMSSDAPTDGGCFSFHGSNDYIVHEICAQSPYNSGYFRDYATWTFDGEAISSPQTTSFSKGELHLVTATLPISYDGAHANAFGLDRRCNIGGIAYGEVLVFKRTLSTIEEALVREYLEEKWLPTPSFEEIAADADFHFDPSDETTLTYDEEGYVVRIDDVRKNGVNAWKSGYVKRGAEIKDGLLDFGTLTETPPNLDYFQISTNVSSFKFTPEGSNLHTIVVVAKRHPDSSQFLLGCEGNDSSPYYSFHSMLGYILHPICTNARDKNGNMAGQNVYNGSWAIDGEALTVKPDEAEWKDGNTHLFTLNMSESTTGTIADMLGQDRICNYGGIAYGEILLFQRALSKRELKVVTDKLNKKWLDIDPHEDTHKDANDTLNFSSIAIAPNASFDFTGILGIVDNATLDFGLATQALSGITVDGDVVLGNNVSLKLTTPSGKKSPQGIIDLIDANAIEGEANITNWVIGGNALEGRRYSLEAENGTLSLTLLPKGMVVIIR